MKIKLSFFFLLLFTIVSFATAQSRSGKTTVYIVRHAEKDLADPKNSNPDLNAEGKQRAVDLEKLLKRKKIAAIFSTNFKRTIQTGTPIAQRLGLQIVPYNPSLPKKLAEDVMTKFSGQKVLVIGHSNTVLEMAEAFGATRPFVALTDDDYDFVFRVDIDSVGKATLTTKNYGKRHHMTQLKKEKQTN